MGHPLEPHRKTAGHSTWHGPGNAQCVPWEQPLNTKRFASSSPTMHPSWPRSWPRLWALPCPPSARWPPNKPSPRSSNSFPTSCWRSLATRPPSTSSSSRYSSGSTSGSGESGPSTSPPRMRDIAVPPTSWSWRRTRRSQRGPAAGGPTAGAWRFILVSWARWHLPFSTATRFGGIRSVPSPPPSPTFTRRTLLGMRSRRSKPWPSGTEIREADSVICWKPPSHSTSCKRSRT